MRKLINFIVRFHFFFLFLIFEFLSFFLLIQYNFYQKASYISSSNAITGNILYTFHSFTGYLSLNKANNDLLIENTRLHNRLKSSFKSDGSVIVKVNDTIYHQRYEYIPVKVINNSINRQNNFITVDKGSIHGLKPEMAVIAPSGIVGVIKKTSANFSSVISVLNTNFKVSARIKKNGFFGSLAWDGNDYRIANLNEIPLHVKISYGDTVVTSGYSALFPEGIPVGTIIEFNKRSGVNFYEIKVRLLTDFKNLSNVYAVKNLFKHEQVKLETESEND
ncbi:MAG: rod shape-determining protein MreC [Bacteroidia bacterium]|nr:rod shape-determining protein MreC [Bacteroidia bacterium]